MFTDYYPGTPTLVGGQSTGINAVTITTAGNVIDVSQRLAIGIIFTAASISSGNGVFSVDGSNDKSNFVTGLAMTDATATASTTYVTSKTLSSNGSVGMYLTGYPFRYIRLNVAVTTDGAYTVTMMAKDGG